MADRSRPETTVLNDEQKDRVRRRLRHTRASCEDCGADDFVVGEALYLGFLFLSEDQDNYMVALTCTTPGCPAPRTGITLRESEFLGS